MTLPKEGYENPFGSHLKYPWTLDPNNRSHHTLKDLCTLHLPRDVNGSLGPKYPRSLSLSGFEDSDGNEE